MLSNRYLNEYYFNKFIIFYNFVEIFYAFIYWKKYKGCAKWLRFL